MAKDKRQPFNPAGQVVVRRPFRFQGREFKAGKEFPWRTLGCPERKLRQLYDARYVDTVLEEAPDTDEDEAEKAASKQSKRTSGK